MSEEFMGPTITAMIHADKTMQEAMKSVLAKGDDLAPAFEQALFPLIKAHIEELVTLTNYNHDGFSLGWEHPGVSYFEGELHVDCSPNVYVKTDDFDFFDRFLQEDLVLESLLEKVGATIKAFLAANGFPEDKYRIEVESSGFGYG